MTICNQIATQNCYNETLNCCRETLTVTENMTRKQPLITYPDASGSVSTDCNSWHPHVVIIHRAQDNSWTTDNFWSTVLYVWPL